MEVATNNSESQLGARSGVANESRECGRERESQKRVANVSRKCGSRMGTAKWVANVGREGES